MSNETLTIWPQRLGLGPEVARVSSWSGSIRWSSRPRWAPSVATSAPRSRRSS